ncbi:MAG TPA: S8 family peptidase [Gaiellaceae bacterium]|nr:S8 family peptidase [Gaiellaceae bacterium]
MAQWLRLRLAAFGILVGLIVAAPAAVGAPGQPAEVIVGFRDGVTRAEQDEVLAPWAAHVRKRWSRIDGVLASVPAGRMTATLRALKRDRRVEYAEPNYVLRASTSDPHFDQLWGLGKIDAPEAWGVTTGSPGVVVAVIDSGVDFNHPDLAGARWVNPAESCDACRSNGVDDDGNGYVDDWRGWDFANNDNDPSDDNGHGTHVAGTIGAVGDNAVGITGVSQQVRLMGLKFIGADGSGTAADAVSAILYAAANGADVTNNSYGGDGFSQAMLDAIQTADSRDSLFVAAAGNDFSDNDAEPVYPAGYDVPNVVSVAASDADDDLAWFSNYGRAAVDLAAPGMNVFSTSPGGGYRFDSGTSMAAPHVAGAAALAKAAFPAASDVGLKALLLRSVDPVSWLQDVVRTGGRLNVNSAVRCAGAPRVWVDAPAPAFEARVGEALEIGVLATHCATPGVEASVSVNGAPVALTSRADGLFTGSFTPSSSGAIAVTASAETDSHSVSGMAVQNYVLEPGGAPVTTTSSAGENATLTFQGVAGRRVALKLSGVTIGSSPCCSAWVSVPGLVQPSLFGRNGLLVDTKVLPTTGTYTILVDPIGADFGSATLTLYDVPPDVTASISPGGAAVSVTTGPVPGQNAVLSFHGLAGQRVSLKMSDVSIGTSPCCAAYVSIPDVFPGALFGRNGLFVDTKVLPTTGTYNVVVDPLGAEVGSATVTLYDVPPDASVPLTGPTTVSAGSVPGQNAVATRQGTAGQRILVRASNVTVGTSTCCSLKLSIPGVTQPVLMGRNGGIIDTVRLPSTGTYSVMVDPQGMDSGSVTLQAFDVPEDVTGSIAPGGAPVSVTVGSPGQNAALSFSGLAGQRVSLKLSGVTIGSSTCCSAKIGIVKPDGSSLVMGTLFGTNGGFVDTKVLPVSGMYKVVLDPQGMDVGGATATLYEVPPDMSGSLTVGGPGVSVSLGTPGQNAVLSFSGAAGQRVTVRASGVTVGTSTCCSFVLSIKRPDGVTVATILLGTNGGAASATLSVAGTYSVVVDPQSANIGGATIAAT